MARQLPFPAYPDGWFCVADSHELAPGELKAVRYVGRELILWRTASGEARLADAHCPHLGAHIGVGGKVLDDTLRCPFHGWRFDAAGRCVEVPYAKRIPPHAALTMWPVAERNGSIFAWHHAKGVPPSWEVPVVPEWGAEDWSAPVRRSFRVRAHCQEMAENVVDDAHFRYVHGTHTMPRSTAQIDGHIFRVTSISMVGTPRGETEGRIEIASHGFGFGITRFVGVIETLVLITGAPIDEEWSETTLRFMVRKFANEDATKGVGRAFVAEIDRQFGQDIPIWENKIHLPHPLLCDGDGPIALLRRWARQFYSGLSEVPEVMGVPLET
jgi:phenylpropionate dioxygenase-like ring-hydroxylating dioxygenase large terminal subunit